jgi:hypothetical protein
MLWDIDLIFGMWVYTDKLQIKFTFCSGPMNFGRVMALGLWNLAKYFVVTTYFHYAWRYWLDFWLWVYNDELQIKFTFRSGPMIFGRVIVLGLKFGQIFSCHHFFSLCLEILTWFLVWEFIVISYRSTLKFVLVEWFLANLQSLGFEIWPNI